MKRLKICYVGADPVLGTAFPMSALAVSGWSATAANAELDRVIASVKLEALVAGKLTSLAATQLVALAAGVTKNDIAKQHSLVSALQRFVAQLRTELSNAKPGVKEKLENKKREAESKLSAANKIFKDMQDYVRRLMARMNDIRRNIVDAEKNGHVRKDRIESMKEMYNQLYHSYYLRDYYKEPSHHA